MCKKNVSNATLNSKLPPLILKQMVLTDKK